MSVILTLKNVTVRFGGIIAIDHLDMDIEEGSITALIGPNGSGKTTLLNTVSGVYRPQTGLISLMGHDLVGLSPHVIASMGIARTFQNNRVFRSMTVLDNVKCGFSCLIKTNKLSLLLSRESSSEERLTRIRAQECLGFVGLQDVADIVCTSLPYGKQKLVEFARALVSRPRILLLDEPAAGMNRTEKTTLMQIIKRVRESGITVLLVEHDMKLVMSVCDRVTVLNFGKKIAEGTPQEVSRDPEVVRAYIGEAQFVA